MLGDIRRVLAVLDPAARRRGLLLALLAMVIAGLEALSAALVFLLVGMIGDLRMVATSRLLRPFRALFDDPTDRELLMAVAISTAVLSVVKNGLGLIEVRAGSVWLQGAMRRLFSRILDAYLSASYAWHLRRDSAALMQNLTGAVNATFRALLAGTRAAFSELLGVLAMVAILLVKAPMACLVTLVLLGAGVGLTLRTTQRRFDAIGKRLTAMNLAATRTLRDTFVGIRDVKLFEQERRFRDAFVHADGALANAEVERAVYDAAPRNVVEAIFIVGIAAIVSISAAIGPPRGPGLVPLLGLLGYAGLRLLPSVHRIVFYLSQIRVGRPALGAVLTDLADLEHAQHEPVAADGGGAPLPFEHELRVEGVSFAYPGSDREILRGVDVTIRRGEFVGVVGATGAGKSTLTDLLLGLHAPTAGRVTVDGVDLAGRARAWRRRVGCVPQAPYLLDESLADNIAFDGAPDPARLARAVTAAQLDGFVRALPQGLSTIVGERGVRISGGERQRLALARALYRDPDVLVLDEATSSLDHETERAIADALDRLRGQKTLIVVAHRMTTVERCDRLLYLADGRVADTGTHAELLARNPAFRAMVSTPD